MDTAPSVGRKVLHTLGALPLALICYVVVAALAEFVWLFMNGREFWLPPIVPYTFAAIIGGLTGMWAAKAACAACLPDFNRQVVFVVLAGALLLLAGCVAIYLPFETKRIASYAACAASLWAAWMFFWRDED